LQVNVGAGEKLYRVGTGRGFIPGEDGIGIPGGGVVKKEQQPLAGRIGNGEPW